MTLADVLGQVLTGLALGLGLIMPIGAQNLFIIQQGINLGYPRIFYATLATTICDALLITMGALGLGAVLGGNDLLRTLLMAGGGVLLLYLAWQNLRSSMEPAAMEQSGAPLGAGGIIARAIGVSLLNPHAILDTVGVIGAVAVSRTGAERAWFAGGAVLASLIWFSFLGAAAIVVRRRMTDRVRKWIGLSSSAVMALFALLLWGEIVRLT